MLNSRLQSLTFLLCASILALGGSPAPAANLAPVERLDASIDALVGPDATLETVFQRDTSFEGPTWVPKSGGGFLAFTDIPGNVINRLDSDGRVSVLLANVFAGKDPSEVFESLGAKKVRMPGANGTTLDRQGRLVYCAYSDGQIVRLEADGKRTVLASGWAGHLLNAPNDLVYGADGALYFTDSRAGTQRAAGAGIPHEGLYVLRNGAVELLTKDIDHPNGVALSPDEKYLYVSNSRQRNILRFAVNPRGIGNATVFADMSGDPRDGVPDGLKADKLGNIYSTGPGGVWIISPAGKHIGTLLMPGPITNVAFGDADSRTLYVTGSGALYRIRLEIGGKATP